MVMALMLLAATPCAAGEKVGYTGKYPWHVTAFWGGCVSGEIKGFVYFPGQV